jgi:hypothetical protein
MVSISARFHFRSGFRERLKRMDNARILMIEEEILVRVRRVDTTPSVCASKLLFWGLTLVREARVCRAFR